MIHVSVNKIITSFHTRLQRALFSREKHDIINGIINFRDFGSFDSKG